MQINKYLLTFFIAVTICLQPSSAFACRGPFLEVDNNVEDNIAKANVIFEGKLVEVSETKGGRWWWFSRHSEEKYREYKFEVEKSWKGDVKDNIIIRIWAHTCGMNAEVVGARWIFFASGSPLYSHNNSGNVFLSGPNDTAANEEGLKLIKKTRRLLREMKNDSSDPAPLPDEAYFHQHNEDNKNFSISQDLRKCNDDNDCVPVSGLCLKWLAASKSGEQEVKKLVNSYHRNIKCIPNKEPEPQVFCRMKLCDYTFHVD